MNKFYQFRSVTSLVFILSAAGCAGGGMYGNNSAYGNNGMYGNTGGAYGNNGMYGNTGGAYGNNGAYGLGSAANTSLGGAVLAAIIQSMAGSVLNGQIGSQLAPVDQNFRLQQLGGLVQSGAINQAQQWVNPQTGNTIALKPIGQQTINPQTQQKCRNLEETVILQNGKRIRENRRACLNPQTGKWNLVQ